MCSEAKRSNKCKRCYQAMHSLRAHVTDGLTLGLCWPLPLVLRITLPSVFLVAVVVGMLVGPAQPFSSYSTDVSQHALLDHLLTSCSRLSCAKGRSMNESRTAKGFTTKPEARPAALARKWGHNRVRCRNRQEVLLPHPPCYQLVVSLVQVPELGANS